MSPFELPVRRPVATAMLFLAVVLLGGVGWRRLPVELFPELEGDRLFITFVRPGGEPAVLEREILLPLEGRISELPLVAETRAEVRGSFGRLEVRFERGSDLKVRELEVRRMAAELARAQPPGTAIDVQAQDTSGLSRFAMMIHATGGDGGSALYDLVATEVAPRLAAVPGVGQVVVGGGSVQGVTVWIDPDRCAALGVTPGQVSDAVARSVKRLRFLGGLEDEVGRTPVVLDGRPPGVVSLASTRVVPDRPVEVRHVAEVEVGAGREEIRFRVDGAPAVGLILFQEDGANLVRLGRDLRRRVERLRSELGSLGLDLVIGFDAAEMVEEQIAHLERLALSGFLVALMVLYLFLRQWRAVAVVAVAVPVSLLAALALLYLAGQSLNLITLFGLAVAVGLLVDNSVVVYEAVQRQLERGADPDRAAAQGVARTVRAILGASATTAIVFLPLGLISFEEALVRSLLEVVALAILLPLAGSLLVAVGLVPLLAHRLAAPAAVRRLAELRSRRREMGDLVPPDRGRALFAGLLAAALRRPPALITAVALGVLVTVVVALPWVAVTTGTAATPAGEELQLMVRFARERGSLERATAVFERLERAVLELEGVERVESLVREEGGSMIVRLRPVGERPRELDGGRVLGRARSTAEELSGVEVLRPGEAGEQSEGQGVEQALGRSPAEVVLSGPESEQLERLAEEIKGRLESIPEVAGAPLSVRRGLEEIRVAPNHRAFEALGLTLEDVMPVLALAGREGRRLETGFLRSDGRELPLVVRRRGADREAAVRGLAGLRLATPAGIVPVALLASVRQMPAPATLVHHNGRRELSVFYTLEPRVAQTGPARVELDRRIGQAVRSVHRPPGTSVEVRTPEQTSAWFRRVLVPVVLLLYLVMAMLFESLTLPLLVLLALPLTLLGAVWGLVFAGLPLDTMALLGGLALFGLTVNPAILLVDRMQRRVLTAGATAGAAALVAVRERARPVLMTTATTVAGLWPLALVTGRSNEIWPPFAAIVIGGLVTSTLLTLLVVPVGFVFLDRLDRLFGRVGPWVVLLWLLATAAVMVPLVLAGLIESLTWQVITTLLVAGVLLALLVLLLARRSLPEPATEPGRPPPLEVRCLRKVYGLPGAVGRALRLPQRFAERVLERDGVPFHPRDARDRAVPLAVVAAGLLYLSVTLLSPFWRLLFLLAASLLLARLLLEVRRARGRTDPLGRVEPGGVEGVVAMTLPWIALLVHAGARYLPAGLGLPAESLPLAALLIVAALLALAQLARRTARRLEAGVLPAHPRRGPLRRLREVWRRWAYRLFGFDLPRREVLGLAAVNFRVEGGMIGVLGPNGAGKTTLLRQLAGILAPTRGRITLGGLPLSELSGELARYIGYLPQDAGMPKGLSAREYLELFAALYRLPRDERAERISRLLQEVGLEGRADERIGSYSGGMRQRVAVARTLLRLPPLIIVDEPTVGLDPRERIRFRNLLVRLARERIVLFSTHVVEDVAVACDRTIVLAGGRKRFDGPPSDLARVAEGNVWEVTLDLASAVDLAPGVVIADQVPTADGRARLRLIAGERPHRDAVAATPTLEDGYLALVGAAGRGDA